MHRTLSKLAIIGAAYVAIVGLTLVMSGEPALKVQPASQRPIGIVEDWSTHHVVFSNPGTYEEVAKDPKAYARWLAIRYDPRFIMQQMRRYPELYRGGSVAVNGFPSAAGGPEALAIGGILHQPPIGPIRPPLPPPKPGPTPLKTTPLKTDWSESMNSTLATAGVDNYPAKFYFFPTATANCSDFVVYNTGVAGGTGQASIIAYDNLYSGCSSSPSTYWAYNVNGGTIITSPTLSLDGTQVAFIVTPTQTITGCTWTAGNGQITCSGTTFTYFNSGVTGTGADLYAPITGTSIPAGAKIDCVGTASSTNYNTCTGGNGDTIYITPPPSAGSGGTITIAPWETTLGTNAFASLVLLKWASSSTATASSPVNLTPTAKTVTGCSPSSSSTTLNCTGGQFASGDVGTQISDGTYIAAGTYITTFNTATQVILSQAPAATDSSTNSETVYDFNSSFVSPASYRSCTAPCMTTLQFSPPTTTAEGDREGYSDNLSSPFYDFIGDKLYVGDSSGYLHQFNGVFRGNPPSETVSSAFPAGLLPGTNGTRHASNPVYDTNTGLVFVNQYNSNLVSVKATDGTTVVSETIGGSGYDISEGPIVDPTAGKVYVFAEAASYNNHTSGNDNDNGVFQLPENFASGAVPSVLAYVGAGSGTYPVHDTQLLFSGAFDNAFYTTGTGNLYVCGNTNGVPTLYQIPISSGTMSSTANAGPALSSVATPCSPLNEVYNTSGAVPYDWIYASVNNIGTTSGATSGTSPINCTTVSTGCVMVVPVTSRLANTSYALGQMVVDSHFNIEVVTAAGTSANSALTWASSTPAGTQTTDGGVTWTSQGPFKFTLFATSTTYAANAVIVDSHNNLERVTAGGGGTSGASVPSWTPTTFGTQTISGALTFTNQGPLGIVGNSYAAGTSGMVIDNTGTSGATNIYFSTLSSETCQTSGGTAGCAVQASQSAP